MAGEGNNTNPKYDVYKRIAILKKLSEGKLLNEIEVSQADISEAAVIYEGCENRKPSPEMKAIITGSGKMLGQSKNNAFSANNPEEEKKYIENCKFLTQFKNDLDFTAGEWAEISIRIPENENEYFVGTYELYLGKLAHASYETKEENGLIDKETQKTLAAAGFLQTATTRQSSYGANAYAHKLINTPKENRPQGYDVEFAKGAGKDYLDFLKGKVIFDEQQKPIRDDENLKKNTIEQGAFYKKWAEMLAKESFEDFTDINKIRDQKVIERGLFLESMSIEFSQNSEDIRNSKPLKDYFMEGFGGVEYYDRLTDVLGPLQTIGMAVDCVNNSNMEPYKKAANLCFLMIAQEKGGSLKGKNVLTIDPEIWDFQRYSLFSNNLALEFKSMPMKELDELLKTGQMSKEMKEHMLENFESLSVLVNPNCVEEQKKLQEELLTEEEISEARKRVPKYAENPFEKMDIEKVKFSEAFIKVEEQARDNFETIRKTLGEFKKNHPNMGVSGFKKGAKKDENYVGNSFDTRNLIDFVSLLSDPGWSEEQLKEFTNDFCTKFLSSKEERYKLLDKIYDKFDTSRLENYDLSCLSGNDKGTKDSDGLTRSERDLIDFQQVCRAEQTFRTTRYGFIDYFANRYGSFEKANEYMITAQKLFVSTNVMSKIYQLNDIQLTTLESQMHMDLAVGDKYTKTSMKVINTLSDIQKKMLSGEIEPEDYNSVVKLGYKMEDNPKDCEKQCSEISSCIQSATNSMVTLNAVKTTLNLRDLDTLYIDGIRAYEYLDPLRRENPYTESHGQVLDRVMSEGKHRFENIGLGIDKEGNLTPIVQTVEPFDNDFYKEDPGREARVKQVREDINNRLGPNKRFYNYMTANSFDLDEEHFDDIIDKYRQMDKEKAAALKAEGKLPEKTETVPKKSFEEKLNTLKGELSSIDTWYHRNSTEFKNTLEALESQDKKKIVDACTAYINKYVKQDQSFRRRTDLGNARLAKIMEIKCAVKDQQKEEEEKNFEKIEKRAKETRVSLKDRQLVSGVEVQKEENAATGKEKKEVSLTKHVEANKSKEYKELN